jgi:hypothetical protein
MSDNRSDTRAGGAHGKLHVDGGQGPGACIGCVRGRGVTDDVAWYQLPVAVAQPTCSVAHAAARRGATVAISCNFTGSVSVRLRRGSRARTKVVRLDAKGRGRVSTASLSRGTYRVSLTSGRLSVRVAKRSTLRLR